MLPLLAACASPHPDFAAAPRSVVPVAGFEVTVFHWPDRYQAIRTGGTGGLRGAALDAAILGAVVQVTGCAIGADRLNDANTVLTGRLDC